MKQIIIILILSVFTIMGFYVNREYWIGLFKTEIYIEPEKPILEGVAIGYAEGHALVSGGENVAFGYESLSGPAVDTIRVSYAGFSTDKDGNRKLNGVIFNCGETFIGQIGQAGDSLYCDKCKEYHVIPEWYGK